MSPRPARTAADKAKAGRTIKREPHSDDEFREDQDDPAGRLDENEDSDEYVAASDAPGENDDGDEDEGNMDMDMDIDDDNDNNDGERKPKLMAKKPRRRRPAVKTYSVSLDEMNKLLTTHDDTSTPAAEAAEFPAGSVVSTEGLAWRPIVRQSKAAPSTTPKRLNRPRAKKTVSKKGFMHDSEMIPNVWKLSYQAPTSKELRYVSMQEDALRDTVYPNITASQKDFRIIRSVEKHLVFER